MALPQDTPDYGRVVVQGPDQPGIVARVSAVLAEHGANIVALDQASSDPEGGRFFQRTVFHLANLSERLPHLNASLAAQLDDMGLQFHLTETRQRKRVAILVSKLDHCLLELLWRHRRGELHMDVPMVISNHPDLADDVSKFGIPYFHVPVARGDKDKAEKEQLNLLKGKVDLVVLARYMQILSGDFLDEVGAPVINIHHSFLPAFMGAGPYQRAKERGVKLVGATAHYVTEDLDEGPIIEQDVIRVSHLDTARELQQKGADVERLVLARAVKGHCEDRIIRNGNTTVIF